VAFTKRNLQTCTPPDILSYLAGRWAKLHKGAGGTVGASAYTREVSLLRVLFHKHDRPLPYDPSTGAGNPTRYPIVAMFCKGHQVSNPVGASHCAVPLTEAKLIACLRHLQAAMPSQGTFLSVLRMHRDMCIFLFLWEGAQRSVNALRMKWSDFFVDASGPNIPLGRFLDPLTQFV
jgi:hypothetical protein